MVRYFYPRSPCGERHHSRGLNKAETIFLSTLSLRRATARRALGFVDPDISIHALLAESDSLAGAFLCLKNISIHALLAESDKGTLNLWDAHRVFLSTLSLRRATARRALGFVDPDISIHALLAESDRKVPLLGIK